MTDYSPQAIAAAWATRNTGSAEWNWYCELFVEQAFGTRGQYGSALAAGNALLGDRPNRDLKSARPGDLVFFSADDTNNGFGHVGIYVGDGKMVSATANGVKTDSILGNAYWAARFRGTAPPPPQWKGRPATADLAQGALTFQRLIESKNVPTPQSYKTAELETQYADYSKRLADAKAARGAFQQVIDAYGGQDINRLNPQQKSDLGNALDRRDTLDKEIAELDKNVQRIGTALGDSRDDDAKSAGDPTKLATAQAQLQTAQANAVRAQAEAEQAASPEAKAMAAVKLKQAELEVAQANVALYQAQNPESKYTQAQLTQQGAQAQQAQVQAAFAGPLAQAQIEQINAATQSALSNIKSPEERRAALDLVQAQVNQVVANTKTDEERAAGLAQVRATTDQIISSIKTPEERQAALEGVQANTQATLSGIKTPEERQAALDAQRAQTAQARSQTLSDTEVQARQRSAVATAVDNEVKARFDARAQQIADLVGAGQLTPEQGLLQLGKYTDFLEQQRAVRQQFEIERHNRETERLQRDQEARALGGMALEAASNAQGSAIFRNAGAAGSAATPTQIDTSALPGAPTENVGMRILRSLGITHNALGNNPAVQAPMGPASLPTNPGSFTFKDPLPPPPSNVPAAFPAPSAAPAPVAPTAPAAFPQDAEDLGTGMAQNWTVDPTTRARLSKVGDPYQIAQ